MLRRFVSGAYRHLPPGTMLIVPAQLRHVLLQANSAEQSNRSAAANARLI
ncbi:hypothetical protein [Rhodopseudomonas sp. BR0G17]|nr:hypothetical protein [Rhodopseudomonas sp. BR0G17]